MNSENEWNQIQILKSDLVNVEKLYHEACDQKLEFLQNKHRLAEQISLQYSPDGDATAIASFYGQERRFLMPKARLEQRYLVCYGLYLKSCGICLDDIEEWFVKDKTVYCLLKNGAMALPVGIDHRTEEKFFFVGSSLVSEPLMNLVYHALPHLFPELGLEVEVDLSERCSELSALVRKLKDDIDARCKTCVQVMAEESASRQDLAGTTKRLLQEEVLTTLSLRNTGQVRRWAKRHNLVGINLRRKAHWALVLERAKLDIRKH